jgi:hypothetical protein
VASGPIYILLMRVPRLGDFQYHKDPIWYKSPWHLVEQILCVGAEVKKFRQSHSVRYRPESGITSELLVASELAL